MSMTPHALATAFAAVQRSIGPNAYVGIVISGDSGDRLDATIHAGGILDRNVVRVRIEPGASFEDIVPALEVAWLEHGAAHRADMIDRMALAIIETTADRGDCPDYVLRMKFSDRDVALYGAEAEIEANVIAGKGPFSISRSTGSNGAPRLDKAE